MKGNKAFTLIELLVVVLILMLLATIAVGLYIREMERARYAVAKSTISEIERAAARYALDMSAYPPSLSLNPSLNSSVAASGGGCGYAEEALLHSIGGSSTAPSDPRWGGPYLTIKNEMLDTTGGPGDVQILDPWKQPYRFVRRNDYANFGTRLPAGHPYQATETWYNPSTVQIISRGPNGVTLSDPNFGRDIDDVSNFGL
ncbi:MAG: prepilin-type N-terminal cleavage/methylation domain-containing protein [Candidatus Sumerlaeaceae bacterium]|nr:prepilin-type N-terminal cleavage/methylation domain-containing protein [Candidatus Sumerlaeaceae bacterium]